MADRLKKHLELMKILHKAKPKLKKGILANVDDDVIKCICECCLNILKGNVEITDQQKVKLHRYKRQLYALCERKPLKAKRAILNQTGGLVPAVLGPLLAIVGSLFVDALAK